MTVDLFNPPKTYNYNFMTQKINVEELDNPYVQVIWEDTQDNFSQDRIKSVKQYFQKKYQTTNVNVITKAKLVEGDILQTVDVSFNILDKNYQKNLVTSFLTQKKLEKFVNEINELDNSVENRLIANSEEVTSFKKWFIKKIEFSNFLSYGDGQILDFDKLNGIVVVESDPPNFGGKTVLTVDLLMFLFFNTTTKTTKAEEIFNRFSDKDKVYVKGEITIDGEDYLIVRTIERKKSKSGEWNVKTDLDFFKKLSNGEIQNFSGEQRKETEKFIKSSIGEQEDFLMTILTTSTNLEDLIDSKPTARGQIISKFLGLEFLRKKDETAKEMYSEFSKGMLSNVYNSEKLKQDNQEFESQIIQFEKDITEISTKVEEVSQRLKKGQEYKESLIQLKFNDIDQELIIMNPSKIEIEIQEIVSNNENLKKEISEVIVKEPSEFYHEEKHDKIKEEYNETYKNKLQVENKIKDIEELKSSVSNGIKCEHCGIELMNAAITNAKISELDGFIVHKTEIERVLTDLSGKEKGFVQLKKEFDEYEKNKLIKGRLELNLETNELKKSKLDDKLKRYFDVQEKIKKNNELDQLIIKSNLKIDELEREKKSFNDTVTTNLTLIKNLKEKISRNIDYLKKMEQEYERERIFKIYTEVFGKNGISKIIMKNMMPFINSELQRLLQDSSYFRLEIRISDKNEVEFWMIDNSTGIEKLMSSGSGYERTIASLALRAVLSKVCSLPKPNIIVMDEVFGKISNDNLELVSEFFQKIKDYFEKIFVISHNPLISNWADSIVKISKKDNISRLV